MLALFCIALGLTGLTSSQDVVPGELSFDWQEISPNTMIMVSLDNTWTSRGLSFSVNSNTNNASTTRVLSFLGPDLEYLGFLAWTLNAAVILDAEESDSSCGVAMFAELDVDDMSGEWRMGFEGGSLSISYSNEARGVESEEVLNESISGCAGWIAEAQTLLLSEFSDQSTGSNDSYKYSSYSEGADTCSRGEFWLEEQCRECPPGKSTIRQGYTEYRDCIETRYISCGPGEVEMECERAVCPCNETYEECDRDEGSDMYGMCQMRSDNNSASGVTGAAMMVTMIATYFTL